MKDKLTVGELKQQLQMLDDSRQVFVYDDEMDTFKPARSAFAGHDASPRGLIFVVFTSE